VVSKPETGMPATMAELGEAALAMMERNMSTDLVAAEKCLG
jgi:hypothetical protein